MFKSPHQITDSSHIIDRYIHYLARSIIWIGLLSSSLGLMPLLAAPLAPGTSIENQATGSFTDGEDPAALVEGIVSNIVKVTVAEVAGITITAGATPAATNGAISKFEFTITNIGNDPTKFFLSQTATVTGGTQGTLQVIAYIDATGTKTTLATPISITNSTDTGALSDPTLGANTTLGSIPVGAAIVVSVPVMVTATSGTVSVTLGNTTDQPATSNTPYLIGANGLGTNDVYTVDHADPNTILGESPSVPINGIREASAVLASTNVVNLVPFTCDNTFHQVRNNGFGGSEVLTINRDNPDVWMLNTPIKTFSYPVHALGYNPIDRFLYAFDASVGVVPTTKLIKIDRDGLTTETLITGATTTILNKLSVNAFTVDSNGTGYLWDSDSHQFFTIDLSTGIITVIPNSQDFTRDIGDIAFNPIDGMIYGMDNTVQPSKLIKFNPAGGAGSITTIGSTGIAGSAFGSIYFDGNGSGYGYNNAGNFYQFNLTTGAAYLTSNSQPVGGSDGASCIAFASPSKPNLLLVKRITAINGNTSNGGINLNRYDPEDDLTKKSYPYDKNVILPNITPPSSDKWPGTTFSPLDSTFLIGARDGGNTKPNDTVEYTIYFLSAGNTRAKNVLFCDLVPNNVTFMPIAFNGTTGNSSGLSTGDRGITIGIGNTINSYTNVADGDIAEYFPPGVDPTATFPTVNCLGTNTNGAVVVNLGNIPNATGVGTPLESYGFVRFRGRVK